MNATKNMAAGLAGAIVLNLLHEGAKKFYAKAPRVDRVGEEAISKSLKSINIDPPTGKTLFGITLATDLLSNAAFYSMVGSGKEENILWRGAGFGLAAGVGALTLTKPLGLNDEPVNKSVQTQILTVTWYLIGGLAAAVVARGISDKPKFQKLVNSLASF
ncbi:hypothetical protein DYBT9623_00022 [Dyadobacter sp. CECT 9623]|uniref:Uncharacterized protein n=1 Tax=Dyadobacter linearis TaxID=2823330 RepID=A0ABM8UIM3_9BACT|nr:hypothetical protein [Dyadobacter sp. CECT 9623]CAG5067302.1 hypothetical protein DYBT9623_00022 [Dyadobacter sp. CECT 9623]